MNTLTVQRIKEYKNVKDLKGRAEDSTIGIVTLTDESGKTLWRGYSCENAGPSTDTPMQDKRIVAREYDLEWTSTTKNTNMSLYKWRNIALWVTCDRELKSFRNRRILIHCGNFPSDSEGCILIGTAENKRGAVNSSVVAIIDLFTAIDKLDPKNVKLVVKEIQ